MYEIFFFRLPVKMALKYCSRMNSLLMARMLQAQTTEQILHSHISQTIINPGMHTHTCCKHPAADFHRIIGPQGHPQSILSHVSSWHRKSCKTQEWCCYFTIYSRHWHRKAKRGGEKRIKNDWSANSGGRQNKGNSGHKVCQRQ